jgi:UDP-4-amino-4-deoxy-L-arabinose formyltransferase/UDP-glucuronic acid dehydrogenase (UDP-4-keto-hexauronic acid decarboxylating)
VKYRNRVVFPSTSEVYGMCPDGEFDEETSPLVTGPIAMQRWIYSTSKQLLDRVIWAYGQKHGLHFTLFRPFNFMGPKLDSLNTAKEGSSRLVTQFVWNLIQGEPLQLVDGGTQRRCFIDVEDAMDGLMMLLRNEGGKADGGIFNIGNPANDHSVREVAEMLRELWRDHPRRAELGVPLSDLVEVSSGEFYGKGYQDVLTRTPSIARMQTAFGFAPKVGMKESLARSLDFFLQEHADMEQVDDEG